METQDFQIAESVCPIGLARGFLLAIPSFVLFCSLCVGTDNHSQQQQMLGLQEASAAAPSPIYDGTDGNHTNQTSSVAAAAAADSLPSQSQIAGESEQPNLKDNINNNNHNNNHNNNNIQSQEYQNVAQGIKIRYPNKWTFSEENGSIVRFGQQKYLQSDDGSFVAFYSPLENGNDTHLANLRIYAKDLPPEIEKLSGKSHLSLLNLYSIYFSQFLRYSNNTIVVPAAKTVVGSNNDTFYSIEYTVADGNQQQRMLDMFTLYNNKIYGLRYTADTAEYSKYLPIVSPMIKSFEFTPKNEEWKKREDWAKTKSGPEEKKDGEAQPTGLTESQDNRTAVNKGDHQSSITNSNDFTNGGPSNQQLNRLKEYTLTKINSDRQKFGLDPVIMSNNSAAQYQAENVLSTKYMSHMTTDGEKPYILYSKLGGHGKLRQNVALIGDPLLHGKCVRGEIDCKKINPLRTINLLEDIMVYNDAHANWHHRYNILDAYPTHVSLGIAYDDYSFALVQNFENNYINLSNPITIGETDNHVMVSGTLLGNTTRFHGIEIYYDDMPSHSLYEKYKDPNLYQPGKLVAAVKDATNVGFSMGNTTIKSESNSPEPPSTEIPTLDPTKESYFYPNSTKNSNDSKHTQGQQSISLEFDMTDILKGNRTGVYTLVIVLEDKNNNNFPGGAYSIFYHG
jgi:hypothetical protein